MSLITRCPVCQTLFKVVPDQLRISEGWVRCGQCDEAFDAPLHLVQSSVLGNVETVLQKAKASPEEALLQQETFATPADANANADAMMVGSDFAGDLSETEPPQQVQPAKTSPLLREAFGDLEPDSHPATTEVSFLRHARAPAAGSSLYMRVAWAFLSFLLALGLAGQIVLQERDRIAAFEPDLQPWLQVICDRLNCKLLPWRKIEMLVIDSSAFTRVLDDSYRLSLTLKNMATVPVGMPALELTLTDTLDQPVIRRIISINEINGGSDAIAAGMEFPVVVTVAVNPGGGGDRIAGYRLLAFYP